jgi:hypothetical protein
VSVRVLTAVEGASRAIERSFAGNGRGFAAGPGATLE